MWEKVLSCLFVFSPPPSIFLRVPCTGIHADWSSERHEQHTRQHTSEERQHRDRVRTPTLHFSELELATRSDEEPGFAAAVKRRTGSLLVLDVSPRKARNQGHLWGSTLQVSIFPTQQQRTTSVVHTGRDRRRERARLICSFLLKVILAKLLLGSEHLTTFCVGFHVPATSTHYN